ncbi:(Fe-S)-binding protein [Paenactinomyces guangxiensis]|uniref:Glycolate oxidase iron-sulfur subunit n=1 Tax=Paenactinomyces guangxiensis TaxID=1490290 RepID=A0A7W1WPL3_9BACL|nr:(Fe-S)-binding protein [Paenactinomyces guangxiensis]MBA4493720.1 (Fe-S)-binding protein [Paenactinomyces guangxiensis]MBH8591008.1 (Fe-S)-binding protein [Paenactinomyces guangxiensis]
MSGNTRKVAADPSASRWDQVADQIQLTLDQDQLTNCMRCGFCLPACPTYRETGLEAASPRGRIALMKAVHDGLIKPDQSFAAQMDLCLGCRACEPACPAGVTYGRLLEQTRASIQTHHPRSKLEKAIRDFFFRYLFPHPERLRLSSYLLAFYQRTGLRALVHHTGLSRVLPAHLRQMDCILPTADPRGSRSRTGEIVKPEGKPIGRVGMFRGCIMDIIFTETNQNTVKLLTALGYEVVFPDTQTCCGALHAHAGEKELAIELAKQNIAAFKEWEVDWIASNAGGCGAMLIEYPHLLEGKPDWEKEADWFAGRIKDVSQLIVEAGDSLPFRAKVPQRVTYQDSCHLRNGMKITVEPRRLIRSIPGVTFVELFEADRCCGSAGIYNLTQPEMSMNILDEKMEHVKTTGADILITSNPGCLLQMKLGIERAGLQKQMRAVHLIDFLAECLDQSENKQEKAGQEI